MIPKSIFTIFILFPFFWSTSKSQDPERLYYHFKTTWDNQTLPDVEIHINFRASTNETTQKGLIIQFEGPIFNNPLPPVTIPGQYDGLWNHEVIEVFFLGANEEYLEIEVSPSCHYLAYYLRGYRNIVETKWALPNTRCSLLGQNWVAEVLVPEEYIPPEVNKFNAYAIHNSDPNRVYMSLFPVPHNSIEHPQPDFHKLEFFEDIDLSPFITIRPFEPSGGAISKKNIAAIFLSVLIPIYWYL